jgi:uncharacterized membrane protein
LSGSDVDHAGAVLFRDAPAGRGTEVKVELQFNPPAGAAGAFLSALWGRDPDRQIADDLHRLKNILEIGEVITTKGQPRKRTGLGLNPDPVEVASEGSFPASDAPSFSFSG